MFTLICFIRTAMLRMCLGLLVAGFAVATHAAQPKEDYLAPVQAVLIIQTVRSDADWLLPYRLNTSVALTRSTDIAPIGSGLSNTPQLPLAAQPEKEAIQIENAYWRQADGGHISLRRLLSVKFEGEQGNLTLRPNSILIETERLKFTVRLKSISMEAGQFKLVLRPHLASMAWAKTF